MIYTLEYIKKEAEGVASYWNGSDDKFVDSSGDVRTEDDVNTAEEIIEKVEELEHLIKELGI